jgi:hypothetical protein
MDASALEGAAVIRWSACLSLVLLVPGPARATEARTSVIVVVGAEGEQEFGEAFRKAASDWESAAKLGGAALTSIGLEPPSGETDRERLKSVIAAAASAEPEAVWLVLIGHGTFDGKSARFNMRGADVSAAELAEWITPIKARVAILHCFSASGPFLAATSAANRVVVTATRSGHEYNYSRLGEHLAAAIRDPAADLDKDEQVSLLEAWLFASSRLAQFYAGEGRLATEHSLLDDNGDKLGTPAEWFKGTRVVKTAKEGLSPDGLAAGQMHLILNPAQLALSPEARARRDEIERQLAQLRLRKADLPESDYLKAIEPLLLELARLHESPVVPAQPPPAP